MQDELWPEEKNPTAAAAVCSCRDGNGVNKRAASTHTRSSIQNMCRNIERRTAVLLIFNSIIAINIQSEVAGMYFIAHAGRPGGSSG